LAKSLFDKYAASIVEEIIVHGYLEMSSVLLKVVASVLSELEEDKQSLVDDVDHLMTHFMAVRDAFTKLAEGSFVERTPQIESSHLDHNDQTEQNGNGHSNGNGPAKTKAPKFVFNEYERFSIPNLTLKCNYFL
jgi:hypothetical protein